MQFQAFRSNIRKSQPRTGCFCPSHLPSMINCNVVDMCNNFCIPKLHLNLAFLIRSTASSIGGMYSVVHFNICSSFQSSTLVHINLDLKPHRDHQLQTRFSTDWLGHSSHATIGTTRQHQFFSFSRSLIQGRYGLGWYWWVLVPSPFQISREMSLIILYIGGIWVYSIRYTKFTQIPRSRARAEQKSIQYDDYTDRPYTLWHNQLYSVFRPFGVTIM